MAKAGILASYAKKIKDKYPNRNVSIKKDYFCYESSKSIRSEYAIHFWNMSIHDDGAVSILGMSFKQLSDIVTAILKGDYE